MPKRDNIKAIYDEIMTSEQRMLLDAIWAERAQIRRQNMSSDVRNPKTIPPFSIDLYKNQLEFTSRTLYALYAKYAPAYHDAIQRTYDCQHRTIYLPNGNSSPGGTAFPEKKPSEKAVEYVGYCLLFESSNQ